MRRKIHPVEAALMEYQDQGRIIVDRSKYVPPVPNNFPLDISTEVECMFASLYDQSRRLASHGEYEDVPVSMDASLHDALNEHSEVMYELGELSAACKGMSRIEAYDPHLLTDEARRRIEELKY